MAEKQRKPPRIRASGHVVQRGKSPAWWVVLSENDPSTGKRRRRWIKLPPEVDGRRKAEVALGRILVAQADGMLPPPGKVTVTDVLRAYVESRKVAGRAPRTIEPYTQLIEKRVVPALGRIPAQALRPGDIEAFYAAQLAGPRYDRKSGPASPSTVAKIHAVLRAAFRHAVKQGTLVKSPVDAVTPPQPSRTEQKVLAPAQAAALLKAAKGHRLYGAVFLALSACMREGELLGLRWSDIDPGRRSALRARAAPVRCPCRDCGA